MTARKWTICSLSCIILFALIMHWPVFLQGKTVSAFDLSYFRFSAYRAHRPSDLKRASNSLLTDGVLQFNVWDKAMYDGPLTPPWLWNPYAGCGSPLLANGQAAPFFPLKAVAYGLAGVLRGFGFLCFLKMLTAGLFMWVYLRALGAGAVARTLGGIAFMASGFMIVWLQGPHTSAALALPLLFLGCEYLLEQKLRRGLLVIIAATALSLLGGHPETTFHTTVAAAVYVIGRLLFACFSRRKGNSPSRHAFACVAVFVLAIVLGTMIAAIQVVPSIEYIRHGATLTVREEAVAASDRASVLSLGNRHYIYHSLLAYLVPNAWGNPSDHDHWWSPHGNFHSFAGYVGIGGILLASLAWRYLLRSRTIGILCLLQLLSLGFALKIPLFERTLGQLPVFDITDNQQFLLICCFTSAALAALAFERLLNTQRLARIDIIWLSLIAFLFVTVVTRDYLRRFASNPYDWIRGYGRTQLAHFLAFLVPWFALVFLPKLRTLLRQAVCTLLVVLLAADLYLIYFGYNPFIKPGQLYPETPALRYLQAEPSATRVLPIDVEVGPNVLTLYGLQDPRVFDAVSYAPYAAFLTNMGCFSDWNIVRQPKLRWCSIAGIRYLFAHPEWVPEESKGVELVYEDDVAKIYANREALPCAYVSHEWRHVRSPTEAYELLSQEAFHWKETALVESTEGMETLPAPPEEASPPFPATILERCPHSVTVGLPHEGPGLLVLSDCYFPGWRAEVDGQERAIVRVNGTFRGVFVEPGDKHVVFTYEPASFKYGLILSVAGVAIFLVVLLKPLRVMRRIVPTKERHAP